MSSGYEQRDLGFAAPAVVDLWQRRALIIGVVFSIAAILGWALQADQFYRSYLLGFILCFGLTIGSLAVLMLYHLTGGAWGTVIRRILEAASRTIWLLIVFFLPIILGLHRLYSWSRPQDFPNDAHLQRITTNTSTCIYLSFAPFCTSSSGER